MTTPKRDQPSAPTPLGQQRLLWLAVVGLALVGIGAGVARVLFLDDLLTIGDAYRERFFVLVGLDDPFSEIRAGEIRWFDGRFADHPLLTTLHASLGAALLVLGPLQLSSRVRARWIGFHRWSGRVVVVLALVIVGTSLPFGVGMPFGGWGELVITILVAGLVLGAIARALLAVRRGDIGLHREWMLRGFAAMIGISTIRVVGAPLDLALTPLGVPPRTLFAVSLWIGWGITLGAAEVWIRRTRNERPLTAAAASPRA